MNKSKILLTKNKCKVKSAELLHKYLSKNKIISNNKIKTFNLYVK